MSKTWGDEKNHEARGGKLQRLNMGDRLYEVQASQSA